MTATRVANKASITNRSYCGGNSKAGLIPTVGNGLRVASDNRGLNTKWIKPLGMMIPIDCNAACALKTQYYPCNRK